MNKIALIIKREYLTRVKKTSFLVMTLVGPLLMAALMIVPAWLALKDKDVQIVEVIDETGQFINQFESTETLKFDHQFISIEKAKEDFYETKYTSILYINSLDKNAEVEMFYKKQPGVSTIKQIENTIESAINSIELKNKFNITKDQLEESKSSITVKTIYRDITGSEESKSSTISSVLGLAGAVMIYFFVFMYGIQVMRGVIEEKTSRIVEIIISSVKPFQLMMGKILGIALVGLTQFILWMVLTGTIVTVAQVALNQSIDMSSTPPGIEEAMQGQNIQLDKQKMLTQFESIIDEIPIFQMLFSFLFYFLGGYLLYAALLAAIGSAVDSEADTQQFMMPVTIPLIFSFVVAQTVIENPDGAMAFWLSIFPLTSPIIMMVRIPFGVDAWELILSMVLLVLGFVGTTWMAGKIYRTGILMYGKKVNYKELWKWLFYKG
ncbi:ABC transporter permease [Vicingus serpentipes]|uniref:ABC transporter permease n=2 Tax=Vicingus serpentipes TaxID=1926625 RepID=A0A5C6RU66_9FLAO|nr:ABC transporter permease [Vicingus serpentipes]